MCDATAPEATILYVNPAFGRITGYETQEVIGQPLRFLQGRATPQDQLERLERALIQRRAANLLLRSQRKDGKPFWNDMHVNPILEDGGHVAHFVAFITDASPRIRAEENLREAKHVAEIANRAKSDFLANVSHELRTPLNAIIGFSEIMQMQMFGAIGHTQYAAYADDIHLSGKHLLSIINDILDLSKIEAGRFQLHVEPVDIEETFEDCARLVRERAENAGLQVVRRIDPATPRLIADKRAVKQILINLLSNAIKFTPQGGQVTLSAHPTATPGWVALSVADTGIGIPPEQIDNALSRLRPGRQPLHPQPGRHRPRPADREVPGRAAQRPVPDRKRGRQGHQDHHGDAGAESGCARHRGTSRARDLISARLARGARKLGASHATRMCIIACVAA